MKAFRNALKHLMPRYCSDKPAIKAENKLDGLDWQIKQRKRNHRQIKYTVRYEKRQIHLKRNKYRGKKSD